MANVLVAEGHFKLLTELIDASGIIWRWRVGRLSLGDRREPRMGVSLRRSM